MSVLFDTYGIGRYVSCVTFSTLPAGNSLIAWARYFEHPTAIHGVGYVHQKTSGKRNTKLHRSVYSTDEKMICEEIPEKCDSINVMFGDQSDQHFLRDVVIAEGANISTKSLDFLESWEGSGYDVIIDDGSHVPFHQVLTFMVLFPALRPGGIYIIEDIETNYWNKPNPKSGAPPSVYGYPLKGTGMGRPFSGPKRSGNAVEKFKQVVDVLQKNTFSSCLDHNDFYIFGPGIDTAIHSITFGNNHIAIYKLTQHQKLRRPSIIGCNTNPISLKRLQRIWMKQNPVLNV